MGGLFIKTLREAAAVNGHTDALNTVVVGFGLLLLSGIAALFVFWGVVRFAKWAWAHPL